MLLSQVVSLRVLFAKQSFSIRIFLSTAVIFFTASLLWAHPPTDMKLSYDPKAQVLHVEIHHVSHNLNKHKIRRLLVYKNREEPLSLRLPTQTAPSEVIKDIPLKAAAEDVIRVEAICSEGGRIEQALVISPEDLEIPAP